MKTKVVGVKIDTTSPKTKDKIYYYKTDKNLKRGDVLDIKVPSGGTPTATVSIGSSKKDIKGLKTLEEAE